MQRRYLIAIARLQITFPCYKSAIDQIDDETELFGYYTITFFPINLV